MLKELLGAVQTMDAASNSRGKCPFGQDKFCTGVHCELFSKESNQCTFKLIAVNQMTIAHRLESIEKTLKTETNISFQPIINEKRNKNE